MLISKIFTGLALLSASATTLASPTPVHFSKIERTSLTKRAVPLVQVPVCVGVDLENQLDLNLVIGNLGPAVELLVRGALTTLNINLNDVALGLGTACLCLQGDVINPDNVLTVRDQLISGSGVLGGVVGLVPTLANPLLDALSPVLNGLLIQRREFLAGSCPAGPTGSVPRPVPADQCQPDGDCPIFDCPASLPQDCPVRNECIAESATCCPLDQKDCGNGQCVPIDNMCPSAAMTVQRRSVKERSRYACRQPLSACPVSHLLARDGSSVAGAGFECLDTLANIESCGGCISPFKGNVAGQDCTAIANADDVACAAGTCIVGSCVAGFVPSADGSACVASSSGARFSIQGFK